MAESGYAGEIFPQLYRYDLKAGENTVKESAAQLTPALKAKIFFGILTSPGDG